MAGKVAFSAVPFDRRACLVFGCGEHEPLRWEQGTVRPCSIHRSTKAQEHFHIFSDASRVRSLMSMERADSARGSPHAIAMIKRSIVNFFCSASILGFTPK